MCVVTMEMPANVVIFLLFRHFPVGFRASNIQILHHASTYIEVLKQVELHVNLINGKFQFHVDPYMVWYLSMYLKF